MAVLYILICFVDRLWHLQLPGVGDMLFEMSWGLSTFILFTRGEKSYDVKKNHLFNQFLLT